MKKHLLILSILLLTFKVGHTQWHNAIYLDTYIDFLYDNGNFIDVDFVSENSGIYSFEHYLSPSSGYRNWINSTVDAGITWNSVWSDLGVTLHSRAIKTVKNQNTFYHIEYSNIYGPTIWISKFDNGVNFTAIYTFEDYGDYRDFSAIDTSHFFLLSGNNDMCFISKYINNLGPCCLDTLYNEKAQLMFFPDTTTGYIAAATATNINDHLILKSISSGTNWVTVFDDSLMNIKKIFFTSADIGYAVGDSGKIIKTMDGGTSWQYLNSGTNFNLKSVYFINDSVGYTAGDVGLIIKTNDGGISWNPQTTGTLGGFSKIFFVNDSVGFALTGQTLYKRNPPLGIWEVYSSDKLDLFIYPNPATDKIIIDTPQNSEIEILNTEGQVIENISSDNNPATIDISSLASGMYFVKIICAQGIEKGKFIKE
jgi:hypothetical protein